jgi:hypothetical protein
LISGIAENSFKNADNLHIVGVCVGNVYEFLSEVYNLANVLGLQVSYTVI